MAWATSLRTAHCASDPPSVLVCGQDIRFSVPLYMGSWDVAAVSLRPVDGVRMEVSAAAGHCEPGDHGFDRGIEIVAQELNDASFACILDIWVGVRCRRGQSAG